MTSRRLRMLLLLIGAGFGAAVLLAGPSGAAPARPGPITLTQPSGASFHAHLFGDEWYSGFETRAGYTILQGEHGRWRYAERAKDGTLSPSSLLVGRDDPTMRRHLRDAELTATADRRRARAESTALSSGTDGVQPSPSIGSDKSLVILAQFLDQASLGTTPAQWSSAYFGGGKSVAGYYSAASGGQFTFSPASETSGTANDGVVGWVTVGMNHPDSTSIGALNRQATRMAIQAADPYVDYASYDTNNDGVVSNTELHITVIAAGEEASYGVHSAKWLWGHRWALFSGEVPTVDGKLVGGSGYTQFGEMHDTHMAAMGIMVHELGHDLGLPDLYDTDQSSEGMGVWSVMASGSWGYAPGDTWQGQTPPLPDAWSRWVKGWITPHQVTGTETASINAASSGVNGVAVQMRDNPAGTSDWNWGTSATGEYFLVENRQQTGYDASLPGSGLLVLHVDETKAGNSNDAARLVDVEEADGLGQLDSKTNRGNAGDLYRGGGVTAFTDVTNPSSRLNNGSPSGASMTGVSASGASMSATFTAGVAVAPLNDGFATATAVTSRVFNDSLDTSLATIEAGETSQSGCNLGKTVWYSYTPSRDVRLSADTAGSGFDTVMNAWRGSSIGALTGLGCNDDAPGLLTSAIPEFVAQAGQTYYFQVGGYYDSGTGAVAGGQLAVHVRVRPVNDDFAAATTLSGASGSATGNNVNASKEPNEPAHAGNAGGGSVWWQWTAPAGGQATIDTDGSTGADTLLAVYTGSSISPLTPVAANDDINGSLNRNSRVTFTAVAGTTYRIAVDTYNNASPGELVLHWALATAAAPGAPTGVSATAGDASATVSWTPGPDGGSAITGYTVTSSPGGVTKAVGAGTTSTTVNGLTNGTAYTFTVRATNAVGDSPESSPSNQVTPQVAPDPTDLAVSLSLVPHPDTTFAYRATVSRTHDPDLTPVTVAIDLPSTVQLTDLPTGCTDGATLLCVLGPVVTGQSQHVDVTVRPLSPGPHTATASIDVADAVAGNDSDSAAAGIAFVCDNVPTGGDDVVAGTTGDDVLCGLAGDDTIAGGPGDDLLFGGDGRDTLDYADAPAPMVVNLNFQDLMAETGWEKTPGTADGNDLASGFENISGSSYDDLLLGTLTGADRIWGNAGKDTLHGYAGNDRLYGGAAADRLYGHEGKDLLVGGTGLDRLDGGSQRDTCREKSDKRISCEA